MKENQFLFIFCIYAMIDCVKGFEVIKDSLIQREKELHSELLTQTKSHLAFLNQIEERNKYVYMNNSGGDDEKEHNKSIISVISLSSIPHKKISLISPIDNSLNDKAFYHIIDLNKSHLGKFILKNETVSSSQGKGQIDHLLIVKITASQSISLLKLNGDIMASLSFSFNSDLIKVDFSTFDEDNTLLFLTSSNEILVLRADIHLKGSTYATLTAEIVIPTRKSFGINIKQDNPVITFTQHKLHGNKYIVIAYQTGEIFVLNKDLEMKSAISINSPLVKLSLFNGIIFAVKGKEIVFINLLGGNTILLSCANYYDIIDVYFDPADNLLFYLDSGSRLMVMSTKLSIAKVNENECSSIFHYQLPSFALINRDSRVINSKAELFVLASDYIGHIDLNRLSSKGLHIDHYAIYKLSNSGLKDDKNNNSAANSKNNQYEIYHSNVMGKFYLLHNSTHIYRIENDQIKPETSALNPLSRNSNSPDVVSQCNDKEIRIDGRVECNGNLICRLLFNTATNNKNTVFYLYGIVIALLSGIVIFYQRSRAKEERKKKEYEEDKNKTNEVTNEKLQEMLEQIKKIEKYQQMNPLDPNKAQEEEAADEYNNDDNRDDSGDLEEEEEKEGEDFKGHSN